jgi:hypothetical protein
MQYLHLVNDEHEYIFEAILRRDPEGSLAAMRAHLTISRKRLRYPHTLSKPRLAQPISARIAPTRRLDQQLSVSNCLGRGCRSSGKPPPRHCLEKVIFAELEELEKKDLTMDFSRYTMSDNQDKETPWLPRMLPLGVSGGSLEFTE